MPDRRRWALAASFVIALLALLALSAVGFARSRGISGRILGVSANPLSYAHARRSQGDLPQAIRELRRATPLLAPQRDMLLLAAEDLARAGDPAGAAEALRRAAQGGASTGAVIAGQGWVLFWQRRLDEAAAAFQEAIRREPGQARAWAGLGDVRLERDEYAAAREALRRALQIDPADTQARNSLGIAYALGGDPVEAKRCFEDVLRTERTAEVEENLRRAEADIRAAAEAKR